MINFKNNESGSALVLTLMTLLVLMVLGTAVGTATVGSYQLGDISRDMNSAYFIAEAGANMAYEEVEAHVVKAYDETATKSDFIDKISVPLSNGTTNRKIYGADYFDDQQGDQPTATIDIINHSNGEYTIKSVGEVGDETRTVEKDYTVTWQDKNSGGIPTETVYTYGSGIISGNKFTHTGGNIKGDVIIDSTDASVVNFGGTWGDIEGNVFTNYQGDNLSDLYTNAPHYRQEYLIGRTVKKDFNIDWEVFNAVIDYMMPEFPVISLPDTTGFSKTNINLSGNSNGTISGNLLMDELRVSGGATLDIDTQGNTTNLIVKDFNVSGGAEININGGGDLNVYVTESFSPNWSTVFGDINDSTKVNFYYLGTEAISLGGATKLYGDLYAPNASVTLAGGSTIGGSVYSGGYMTASGGTNIGGSLYAIDGMTLSGGSKIGGSVYSSGVLDSSGGSIVSGSLKALGDVSISGGFTSSEGIITGGNVTISGGGIINATILAPRPSKTVTFTNGTVNGSIISYNIVMSNGTVNPGEDNESIVITVPGEETEVETGAEIITDLIQSKTAIEK